MPSSHGGGGFSGGGSSSFSSHGSAHTKTYSKAPFEGGSKYSYINRHGVPCFFYYSGIPKRLSLIISLLPPLLFILFIFIFAAIYISSIYPQKLTAKECIPSSSIICDDANIFSNNQELINIMNSFYNKTGVQPFIYTIEKSTYVESNNYSSYGIETASFNYYVTNFNDEGHWLIYIVKDSSNKDLLWCDMAGDNTSKIITDKVFNAFQTIFNSELSTDLSYSQILIDAFSKANNMTMTLHAIGGEIYLVSAVLLIFLGFSISFLVQQLKQRQEINDYCDYQENNTTTLNGEEINNNDDLFKYDS